MNDIVDLTKITSGLAGMQSQTTVVQHLSNDRCDIDVTPAPDSAIGTVDYYYDKKKTGGTAGWLSRKCDFENRHRGCQHEVPDYYEGYGDKYIRRFTDITYKYLSAVGKAWLEDARYYLQVYMEDGFKQNTSSKTVTTKSQVDPSISSRVSAASFKGLELNGRNFRMFAFGTHPAAYIDGGFINMGVKDLILVCLTPDMKEWTGEGRADTFDQAFEVGMYLVRATSLWKKTKMAAEFAAILAGYGLDDIEDFVHEAHGVRLPRKRLRGLLQNIFGSIWS
ncbi:hypothetical protein CUZ56_03034 [Saezia sanguinis]|uniref:Uncharacterized protein n=1 Tax=Saezia sanguinis TaxID=1965230 RepID=A0A433S9H6_9BURK|nr:hypothetical protein [Saezia sanguinis]RUS65385.1 hypothetical protein CUZ56_03034 [Saezia sanguinis]